MKEQKPEPQEDVRVKTTGAIWGMATGMLGISIPLSAVTETAFIPVVVIVGAVIGTVAVWRGGAKSEAGQQSATASSNDAAQKRIAELEERLANLETINNFERHLAERTLERQSVVPAGEVMRDVQGETTTEARSEARHVAA